MDQGDAKALAEFGDGLQGWYYGATKHYKNREGVWCVKLLIVPTEEIRIAYRIIPSELVIQTTDARQGNWMEYKLVHVDWLRQEYPATIFIASNYDGSESQYQRNHALKMYQFEKEQMLDHARDVYVSRLLADLKTAYSKIDNMIQDQVAATEPLHNRALATAQKMAKEMGDK
jgi:hypothetical protein